MGIRIPHSNVPSNVADEAITKEIHDGLGRATTTASSLEAEQGSGNISKTQTKVTPSGLSSPRTSSEGGPGCHITIWDSPVQARPERLSNLPNEPTLEEENKLRHKRRRAVVDSSEDEEASLDKEDSPKQGRMIKEINEDENTNLVKSNKQGEAHETSRRRKESDDTESAANDKGKAIMQESEPLKKIKKKEMIHISLDEEIAQSIRNFVPTESEDQIVDSKAGEGSSKEGESLKRSAEEELGHEQQKKQLVEEEIVQQEDVVAKQVVKESSKKAGGRLKRKTSKAREDKDKRQKMQDDPE
uniref:Uncharacterized protein n=1 Tax=Tanacetum cinerariifolium TaxID=118510 RepID=A0A6L2JMV2_TANCI|nr:hypothetical protein [Tanacetum cinerariifolium]